MAFEHHHENKNKTSPAHEYDFILSNVSDLIQDGGQQHQQNPGHEGPLQPSDNWVKANQLKPGFH